jgi:glutaredoxin
MKVTLYGAHGCPMCSALASMLKRKNIEFEKVEDIDYIISLGLNSIPVIEFENGDRLDFPGALKFLKTLGA